MNSLVHDTELQELIVRALTGLDRQAQSRLEQAAAKDPELRTFCNELDEVVNLLVGSDNWRREKPNAQLTKKIREAVVTKLPSAPPHFRTVLLEPDLGRERSIHLSALWIATAVLLVAGAAFWATRRAPDRPLPIAGLVVFESEFKGERKLLDSFRSVGAGNWQIDTHGLHFSDGTEPAALYLQHGYAADKALRCTLDLQLPELDEKTGILLFLCDRQRTEEVPAFSSRARPDRALRLEINASGLVLESHDHKLLHSSSSPNARFLRIVLAYHGSLVRVELNNKLWFEGKIQPLQGEIHPGWRVEGSRAGEVVFGTLRIEQ